MQLQRSQNKLAEEMAPIAEAFSKPLTLSYLRGYVSSENLKFGQDKKDVAAAAWLVMGRRVSSVGLVIVTEKLHLEE